MQPHTVHFWEVICFTFIHIVLCSAQQTGSHQDDVIKHCVNSINWPSCSYTYGQVYKSLTKSENSFNISYALYPGRAKPSFLVKVNVFGPNKTSISIPAMYTWSIHCLYTTVPARLLEILSLGSILVTSRTQELNIQIPPFCCNVSDDNRTREKIIRGFLTRALFELQDLAVSPEIRDPSLNTAECVIQGHKPNFDTTERSAYIRAMLWCSLFFAIFSGHLLARYMKEIWERQKVSRISWETKNTIKAMCFSFYFLSVGGTLLFIAAFGLSIYYWYQYINNFFDICIIFVLIVICTVVQSCVVANFCTYGDEKCYSLCLCIFTICGANVISYLFCWLIIGIRINPTWGLTIALIVFSLSAALTYAWYIYLEATYTTGYKNIHTSNITSNTIVNTDRLQVILFCVSGCLSVLLLFVIVVLAGQPYSGKEMATDEVLKTTSLYFISAFISWVTWKKHASHFQPVQNTQPPSNATSQNPEENANRKTSRENKTQSAKEIELITRSSR